MASSQVSRGKDPVISTPFISRNTCLKRPSKIWSTSSCSTKKKDEEDDDDDDDKPGKKKEVDKDDDN